MVDLLRRSRALAGALLVLLFLASCDEAEPTGPCRPVQLDAPMNLPVRGDGALLMGQRLPGEADLTPWGDGQDVNLVFGFQGGYMVTPELALPEESLACATAEMEIVLDGVSAGSFVAARPFQPDSEGGSVSFSIDTFLGFELDSLVGRELTLTALVYTETWRSEPDTRTVVLAPPR